MKPVYIILILAAAAIFGGINYYIGLRGFQNLSSLFPSMNSRIYWIVFWIIAFSYIAARLGEKFLPGKVEGYLNLIGAYWMAAMMYLIIIYPIIDILRFLNRKVNFVPAGMRGSSFIKIFGASIALVIVIGILIYGTYNARNSKVVDYNIEVDKKAGNIKELNIVMVSDIHLGDLVDNNRLKTMVGEINSLNPDIVLMAGDIIDEKVKPFEVQKMSETFLNLKSRLGVYACLGNHEYIGREVEEIIPALEKAGIKVLRDSKVMVDNSFYIAGRDDLSSERLTKKKRMPLKELLEGVDKNYPIILLDHQPQNLKDAEDNGVDIQLSGHTHRGQMFPNELITSRIYELDWGYLKKGNCNIIVSSGYGTWGPPIRIGNSSEIVNIKVNFKK